MSKGISSKVYFQTLNLIAFAQIFTLIIFSVVVLFVAPQGNEVSLNDIFQFLVPITTIVMLSSGYFVFKMLIARIDKSSDLKSKLHTYKCAVIIRSALIEIPGLFAAVATMLTGEIYYLAATVLIVIVFILLRPTVYSAVEDLELTQEEKSKLENPNEIVADRFIDNS